MRLRWYELQWKLYRVRSQLRWKLKHDTCFHFWRWQKGFGPWCVICWVKHEMFVMLGEEIDKQILWGDGGPNATG